MTDRQSDAPRPANGSDNLRFLQIIGGWINEHFANEEAIYLIVLIIGFILVLFTLGGVLVPALIAVVIAFLLQGLVAKLERWRLPNWLAVAGTFLVFLGSLTAAILLLLPLLIRQTNALLEALPDVVDRLGDSVRALPTQYPGVVTDIQVEAWLTTANTQLSNVAQWILEATIAQVPSLFALVVYLILVPILVFFFLKDRERLMGAVLRFLPPDRPFMDRVAKEMSVQLANYVRGKFTEILIVGITAYAVFAVLGLNYAALLALLVGLSVIVPFVGAALVTIPVVIVAFLQWGATAEFGYLVGAYLVLQVLDGNFLVPILFSEANDLHPVAIILAVLVFGGIWGVWGVFFAIPLATLVKAIYEAWPRAVNDREAMPDGATEADVAAG